MQGSGAQAEMRQLTACPRRLASQYRRGQGHKQHTERKKAEVLSGLTCTQWSESNLLASSSSAHLTDSIPLIRLLSAV